MGRSAERPRNQLFHSERRAPAPPANYSMGLDAIIGRYERSEVSGEAGGEAGGGGLQPSAEAQAPAGSDRQGPGPRYGAQPDGGHGFPLGGQPVPSLPSPGRPPTFRGLSHHPGTVSYTHLTLPT